MRRIALQYIDRQGRTRLHWAIENETSISLIRELVAEHVDVDKRDSRGRTALMLAVQKDKPDAIKVLLDLNADVTISDRNLKIPFQVAIDQNNLSILKLLITHKRSDTNEAFVYSLKVGKPDISEYLLTLKPEIDAVSMVYLVENAAFLKEVLKEITVTKNVQDIGLQKAIDKNLPESFQIILDQGIAKPDIKMFEKATTRTDLEIAKIILLHGINSEKAAEIIIDNEIRELVETARKVGIQHEGFDRLQSP